MITMFYYLNGTVALLDANLAVIDLSLIHI